MNGAGRPHRKGNQLFQRPLTRISHNGGSQFERAIVLSNPLGHSEERFRFGAERRMG